MIDKHYLERIELPSRDRDRDPRSIMVEHDLVDGTVKKKSKSALGNYVSPGTKAMLGDGQVIKSHYENRFLYLK